MTRIHYVIDASLFLKLNDTEVLRLADLPSIHTIHGKNQLRWSGHMCPMEDYCLPKRLFMVNFPLENAQLVANISAIKIP